jgi:hypothetical protein
MPKSRKKLTGKTVKNKNMPRVKKSRARKKSRNARCPPGCVKKSRKASRKKSRKASRKKSRKASRKKSRKASRKKSRKKSRKASRKKSRKKSRKASRKKSRKKNRKASRKKSRKKFMMTKKSRKKFMMTKEEKEEAIIEWEKFFTAAKAEYKAQLDNNKQFKQLIDMDGGVVEPNYHTGFGTNEFCGCPVCNFHRKKLEIEYINKLVNKYNTLGINTSFNPNNFPRLPKPNPHY